ncbi:Beta-1,4-galactosyltransferase 1 [Nymphon striatum]|nr:Beta-1,4-galactosyltransferase 1 [Nymphon striatum]
MTNVIKSFKRSQTLTKALFIFLIMFFVTYLIEKFKYFPKYNVHYHLDANNLESDDVMKQNFNLKHVSTYKNPDNKPIFVCPAIPNYREKPFSIPISLEGATFKEPKEGGVYAPGNCLATQNVAIIVPYRNRTENLQIFVRWMHFFLQKQQLNYTIYIIEQDGTDQFNRGMLINIGYKEAKSVEKYNCYIFHDVDLIPLNVNNMYRCGNSPRHLSASVDSLQNRLPYWQIFGGVSAMSEEQMEKVNGFANSYWGWGGEDDDVSRRQVLSSRIEESDTFCTMVYENISIRRYPKEISDYHMLRHEEIRTGTSNK